MSKRSTYQISTGTPRRVYGARDRLKRESHALVVQTTEGATSKQSDTAWWAVDLRRGRRTIYGGTIRFLEYLHRRGVPMDIAMAVPRMLEDFIRALWNGTPSEATVPVELHETGEHRAA